MYQNTPLISIKVPKAIFRLAKALIYSQDTTVQLMSYANEQYKNMPTKEKIKSRVLKYPCNILHDALRFMIHNIVRAIGDFTPLQQDTIPLSCYNWIIAELIHGMKLQFVVKTTEALIGAEDKQNINKLMQR